MTALVIIIASALGVLLTTPPVMTRSISTTLWLWVCALLVGTIALHTAAVMLGAPATSKVAHTFLWSVIVSAFAVAPLGPWSSSRIVNDSRAITRMLCPLLLLLALKPPGIVKERLFEPPTSYPENSGDSKGVALVKQLSMERRSRCAVLWGSRGAVAGAWLGSVLLLLDWRSSWLQWPLPPTYSAWLGYTAGVSLGASL